MLWGEETALRGMVPETQLHSRAAGTGHDPAGSQGAFSHGDCVYGSPYAYVLD